MWPAILPGFLAAYPDIQMEIIAEDSFVDVLASGCDAGIRYDERLEQDTIAVPIGPRVQRYATAAAPSYLDRHGRPVHPRDLLTHACLRGRFVSGAMTSPWEFERAGDVVRIEPHGPLIVRFGAATDLAVDAATGCARIWRAAFSNRCSKTGGKRFQDRFYVSPAAASYRRRFAPFSITSNWSALGSCDKSPAMSCCDRMSPLAHPAACRLRRRFLDICIHSRSSKAAFDPARIIELRDIHT